MSLTATLKNSRVPGLNEYILEHEINHGYFGRVYQGKEVSSEKKWALKFVQKSLLNDRQKRNIVREVNWNFFFFLFFFFPFGNYSLFNFSLLSFSFLCHLCVVPYLDHYLLPCLFCCPGED